MTLKELETELSKLVESGYGKLIVASVSVAISSDGVGQYVSIRS